jgi:hypothetical protein
MEQIMVSLNENNSPSTQVAPLQHTLSASSHHYPWFLPGGIHPNSWYAQFLLPAVLESFDSLFMIPTFSRFILS